MKTGLMHPHENQFSAWTVLCLQGSSDPEESVPSCATRAEEERAPFGFVVTVDKLEKDGKLIYVPLWLFLLMV